MGIKLDGPELERLIRRADTRWFAEHSGQFHYEEHVKYTADYIVRNYKVKTPERREDANTQGKHRGSKKVPQLRLGKKGHGPVRERVNKGKVPAK
jgi:hypothetical protein